jgi:hypothetical protein
MSAFFRGLMIGFAAGVVVGAVVAKPKYELESLDFEPEAEPEDGAEDAPVAVPEPHGSISPEPHGSISLDDLLSGPPEITTDPAEVNASLRQSLLVKYLYDEGKVEQAISRERDHDPEATETEWLRSAIIRFERDNR